MMQSMSRRELLKSAAIGCGAIAAAPMLNLGRYRLFAEDPTEYSERAVRLVRESLVIDMLSPLSLNFPLFAKWEADPELFGLEEFKRYQDSGINIFHIAVGTGGPNAYANTLDFVSKWNSFLAGQDERFMRIDSAGDFDRVKKSG